MNHNHHNLSVLMKSPGRDHRKPARLTLAWARLTTLCQSIYNEAEEGMNYSKQGGCMLTLSPSSECQSQVEPRDTGSGCLRGGEGVEHHHPPP